MPSWPGVAGWLHLLRSGHWWREEGEGAEGIPRIWCRQQTRVLEWAGCADQIRLVTETDQGMAWEVAEDNARFFLTWMSLTVPVENTFVH